MFSDPVSFNGGTRVEVIAVLANCGRDTDRARRALVTWIRHKQDKGRTTEHILIKLREIESKFIRDTTLHSAFRDARAETFLPRAPDLPLPACIKRRSAAQNTEFAPSILTPVSTGRASISSSVAELLPGVAQRTSPSITPVRLSRAPLQASEFLPGNPNTSQRLSLPQGVPRVTQSRSPRIQIPSRSTQPAPNSPVTSSPEELELHLRYRSLSHPAGPSSQSTGLITPVSASPPEFASSSNQHSESRRRSSYRVVSPPLSIRGSLPRSRSQRSFPHSPPTSSSDESDIYPRRYRPMSQPVPPTSPALRRVTPPMSCPPDVPLPPIPSDDQGVDPDSSRCHKNFPVEQPPTPLRSPAFYVSSSTPVRPLPIQPIPSPVPDSDESEPTDTIGADSLRQHWWESNGDLPADIVVRQDSPVYVFHDDHASPTRVGPPPPYIDQRSTYTPVDMPMIGESLDRVVEECGGSHEVRVVVSRCIHFERGYEPPYWQSRLQACGLGLEAARYLVDEMCKQVDWGSSFRRST